MASPIVTGGIRWGILGTANIARASFLPGLRAAGGIAAGVASRDMSKAEQWAAQHGVERGVQGYDALLADDSVQVVYIALPNHLHAEWTIAALRAGKTVLCEKPLCISVEETQKVLEVARGTGGLLWEAFVFPFHHQMDRVRELLAAGAIGEVREIQSNFYFQLRDRRNIRLSREMAGGALNDVGCYCLRLAELIFGSAADTAVAQAVWAPEGVEEEMSGIADYGDGRRLVFSCGLMRPYDTFTRLIGTEGEIRIVNPYHPSQIDHMEVRQSKRETIEHPTGPAPSFTRAIEHIHAVLRGEEQPRHLASRDSLGAARDVALLHRAIDAHRSAPV
jgi:predicted dehydrogenase